MSSAENFTQYSSIKQMNHQEADSKKKKKKNEIKAHYFISTFLVP